MAKANGGDLPFLVAGGGIGGLITAYALARKGFPVRVFEQAGEFKELGAGIQLGPNIFRAIERVGLKASMMDDAWVPPKIEMRDALTGERVTAIPLGEPFTERFGQPYAVTHRADIHGVYLRACQGNNLVSLENSRKVDDFVDEGDVVAIRLEAARRSTAAR
jgi:salicylate hydroxylase